VWSALCASAVAGLRSLLAGEEIEVDGQFVGPFQAAATGIRLPADTPIWVAANRPKGCEVAGRVGDLVLTSARPQASVGGRWGVALHGVSWLDGENLTSESVIASVGPAAAFMLHRGDSGPAAGTPEAAGFASAISNVPAQRRHIEIHRACSRSCARRG
jgi:5,10-methylenetetrahydromethanopterin reductase